MSTSETPSQAFFCYASAPSGRAGTMRAAAREINRVASLPTKTWEQATGGSAFIIDTVLKEIERSLVVVLEQTALNENVLFELGFAVGSRRVVWLLRDPSFPDAEREWRQMGTLSTVRVVPYTSSDDIRNAFVRERPDLHQRALFDEALWAGLQPEIEPTLFYLRAFYETDAGRALTRRIHDEERKGIKVVDSDPRETAYEGLAWYAQQLYASAAVVVHFDDPGRQDAFIHNSRLALIAGMALGMGKRLLMLAPEEYLSPIDYRDLLYVYRRPPLAVSHTDSWLALALADSYDRLSQLERRTSRLRLATELRSLRLGEHVAEHETDVLNEYFVRTGPYEQMLQSRTAVFLGRKGAGKSATAMEGPLNFAITAGT